MRRVRVRIAGKDWELIRSAKALSGSDVLGECCKAGRVMVVDSRLRGREEMDTIIHEAMHAAKWKMPEREVVLMAERITAVMWAAGYRRR